MDLRTRSLPGDQGVGPMAPACEPSPGVAALWALPRDAVPADGCQPVVGCRATL